MYVVILIGILFCRFIGELYKQGMLTTKIMHRCMTELLIQSDEDSLECLCKLLTTVGKDFESKVSPNVRSLFYFMINKKYFVFY